MGFENAVEAQANKPASDINAYRDFALNHLGDAKRGEELFHDTKRLACSNCHTIDGSASKAGPDLFAAGDKFGRGDLITAVLQPSASIAVGYGTVVVTTKSGAEYQGILKKSGADGVELMGADGKLVSIPTADIASQHGSELSLMPEGLQSGLTHEEFTDLVEYLANLKQPANTLASNRGMPVDIPELAHPVGLKPFFSEPLTIPRGRVLTGLTAFHQMPGHSNVFFVLHQKGFIWRMEKTATGEKKSLFAELTERVFSDRGPNGLLDMTFHPDFLKNRKYYLDYQIFEDGKVRSVIEEKQMDEAFENDSGKAAREIIRFTSVAEDHSGGCIRFGPDGYLYVVMGDTGPQTDPNGHAQDTATLLGTIMRIDVDHHSDDRAYSIPADNPFVKRSDVRPEIWAYGFRNPWRFCFDRVTGDLWLGDVGQNRVEEVDIIQPGRNYGWNVYEGFEPFSNEYRFADRSYTFPVFAYRRKYGASVTGGFVYRGDKDSSFYGAYICGDYTSNLLFALKQKDGLLDSARVIGRSPQPVVSFGEDEAGNIYVVGFEGMIYQVDFSTAR